MADQSIAGSNFRLPAKPAPPATAAVPTVPPSAPVAKSGSGIGDLFGSLYRAAVPVNARMLVESFAGKNSPVTERDFAPEELAALKAATENSFRSNGAREQLWRTGQTPSKTSAEMKAILDSYERTRGKASINYVDYPHPDDELYQDPDRTGWFESLVRSYRDPAFRMATTLGRFNAYDRGDHYELKDAYNWNNDINAKGAGLMEIIKTYNRSPSELLNALADNYAPKVSRDVTVRIPK